MSAESLAYEHLDRSREGLPVIAGKNFKVVHLIREHVAYGWSAEELALNHPQLTLGEIYSALAFYADHREQIDRELTASEELAERRHGEPRHRRISSRLKRPA
jgi:uncharacterized protein (DUF433 family)